MREEKTLLVDMSVDVKSAKRKTRICQFLGSHYIHILRGMIY